MTNLPINLDPELAKQAYRDLLAEKERRRKALARKAPKNRKELYEWVSVVLGYKLARTVVTEGHRSPFDFLADAYFGVHSKLLARGCRGSGKTRIFAIHNILQEVTKPNLHIVHVGGTELQARDGYAYYAGRAETYGEPGFIFDLVFEDLLDEEPMVSKTVLKNGSKLEIRTGGSTKSMSGPHPQILTLDELDHISWAALSTGLQMPMTRGKYKAQTIMASSQYHSYGTMQALISEAKERDIEVYEFDIFDVMKSCGRIYPRECRECPLFEWQNPYTGDIEELCRGRGAKSDGHYLYEDACNKFLISDMETFALQNLLMRGTSQGMVYPQFSRSIHIVPFPPEGAELSTWKCFAGVDFRTRGRIVIIAEAPGKDTMGRSLRYVIAGWEDDSSTPSKIRKAATELSERVRSEYGLIVSTFWMEHAIADECRDWVAAGLPGRIIPNEVRNVSYGVGKIRDSLRDASGNITLFFKKDEKSISGLITAIADLYHCKRMPDGSYNRDEFEGDGEDWCDALRYAFVGGAVEGSSLPEPVISTVSHTGVAIGVEIPELDVSKYSKWNLY